MSRTPAIVGNVSPSCSGMSVYMACYSGVVGCFPRPSAYGTCCGCSLSLGLCYSCPSSASCDPSSMQTCIMSSSAPVYTPPPLYQPPPVYRYPYTSYTPRSISSIPTPAILGIVAGVLMFIAGIVVIIHRRYRYSHLNAVAATSSPVVVTSPLLSPINNAGAGQGGFPAHVVNTTTATHVTHSAYPAPNYGAANVYVPTPAYTATGPAASAQPTAYVQPTAFVQPPAPQPSPYYAQPAAVQQQYAPPPAPAPSAAAALPSDSQQVPLLSDVHHGAGSSRNTQETQEENYFGYEE